MLVLFPVKIVHYIWVCQVKFQLLFAAVGTRAWNKCSISSVRYFPSFKQTMKDLPTSQPTDQPTTNHREVKIAMQYGHTDGWVI